MKDLLLLLRHEHGMGGLDTPTVRAMLGGQHVVLRFVLHSEISWDTAPGPDAGSERSTGVRP